MKNRMLVLCVLCLAFASAFTAAFSRASAGVYSGPYLFGGQESSFAPYPWQFSFDFLRSWCGNGSVEGAETCDDGNRRDGDGCSGSCSAEISSAQRCITSSQCGTNQYCTTEDGDCRSACEPGAMFCAQVCAGICKERVTSISSSCEPMMCNDGTSHPTCTKNGHPINYFIDPCWNSGGASSASACEPMTCGDGTEHPTCTPDGDPITYVRDPCQSAQATCGNNQCEAFEPDFLDPGGCGPNADPLCLGPPARLRPGTCPADCGATVTTTSTCGNNMCESNERAQACDSPPGENLCADTVYCPADCGQGARTPEPEPFCGDGLCNNGEFGVFYGCDPAPDGDPNACREYMKNYCPQDCMQRPSL